MSRVLAAARISSPYGWLYLGDGTQYRIGAASFADQAVTFRRSEVSSPYVEGTFVVNALRENVVETLEVYVEGTEELSLTMATRALGAVLCQVNYTVQVQLRRDVFTWSAYAADHTVSTRRELLHARVAQVTAQIPRDPSVTHTLAPTLAYQGLADSNYTNAQLAAFLVSYGELAADPTLVDLTEQVAWPVPVEGV